MGHLGRLPLETLLPQPLPLLLVETGTGLGETLQWARTQRFEKVYSIELDQRTYDDACVRFADTAFVLLRGESGAVLTELVPALPHTPVLWYLDAHFPGCLHQTHLDYSIPYDINAPLHRELEAIIDGRDITHDLFIIDDVRHYEPVGTWTDHDTPEIRTQLAHHGLALDFVRIALAPTHRCWVEPRDGGYFIAVPHAG